MTLAVLKQEGTTTKVRNVFNAPKRKKTIVFLLIITLPTWHIQRSDLINAKERSIDLASLN